MKNPVNRMMETYSDINQLCKDVDSVLKNLDELTNEEIETETNQYIVRGQEKLFEVMADFGTATTRLIQSQYQLGQKEPPNKDNETLR